MCVRPNVRYEVSLESESGSTSNSDLPALAGAHKFGHPESLSKLERNLHEFRQGHAASDQSYPAEAVHRIRRQKLLILPRRCWLARPIPRRATLKHGSSPAPVTPTNQPVMWYDDSSADVWVLLASWEIH